MTNDFNALDALTPSGAGDVRIAPIMALPAVLTELGVRPQQAFAHARVDRGLFRDPENRIGLDALGRLFDACAALTHCDHFGLLVGERFELPMFGPLGHLMRHSATVDEVVRSLLLYLHLSDRGAVPVLLAIHPERVLLGYSIYRHGIPATAQIHDAAIAIGYKIMFEICGSSWLPQHTQFAHAPPENCVPYRRLFRSSVSFDAKVSGMEFHASWLRKPIEDADPLLRGFLTKAIRVALDKSPMSFAEQVQRILHQMVLSGTASADAVAHLFGLSERTLRRRLNEEGKTFMQLINETRFELARQLLADTALSVAEIATTLQYDDPNAFSRAFHQWSQVSPTQWRACHRHSRR